MLNNKHNTDYIIYLFYFCAEVKQLNIFIMKDFCIFEVEAIQCSTISSKKIFDARIILSIHASDIKELYHILNDYADSNSLCFDVVSIKVKKHLSEFPMFTPLPF